MPRKSSIDLMDAISVSDIWQTRPIKRSKNLSIINQTANKKASMPSTEDILSFSLRAQAVENSNKKNKIYFYRSAYSDKLRDLMPDQDVLFHFIRLDLKTQFLSSVSNKSSFLNIYLLWKV